MIVRVRSWMVTIHLNHSDPDDQRAWDFPEEVPVGFQCLIGQLEDCPDTGRWHYQLYLHSKNKKNMGQVKEALHCDWAHCEPMHVNSTPQKCIEYCTKDETRVDGPWYLGKEPHQGVRTDIHDVRDRILDGSNYMDIVRDDNLLETTAKYYNFAKDLAHEYQKTLHKDFPTELYIYWGVSGAGKSTRAKNESPGAYVHSCSTGKWWDNYNNEEIVIIDEFDIRQEKTHGISQKMINKLVDPSPVTVPARYGDKAFMAKRLYIISNENPKYWYERGTEIQLLRRITKCVQFTQPYNEELRTLTWDEVTEKI